MNTQKKRLETKKFLSVVVILTILMTLIPTNFIANAAISSQTVTSNNNTFTLSNDTLTIKSGSDILDLQACSSEILKVNYKPNGEESEDTLVLDPNKKWENGNIVSADLNSNPIVIKTNKMIVKVNKEDLSISVYNSSNGLLVKQSMLPSEKTLTLNHNSGQNFYGISAEGNTNMSDSTLRTGSRNVTAGSQGHGGGPFTWTTSGYGILVDSDGGTINLQDTSISYKGISKVDTEYYILVGNPTEILQAQAKVSGTSPMFPKWATGFTNTQWGWPSDQGTAEEQLKKVIDTYRAKEIPIDNFCLDFDWKLWGTGDDYGEFTWNYHNFPSAPSGQLKSYMDAKGLKLTGIVKPRLFTGTQEAADMDANGWWYSRTGVIQDYCAKKPVKQVDFSKEGLRKWWWQQSQKAFDLGLVGFWNDEVDLDNGFQNFDGLNMQRAIYDGQTAYTSEQRVWSINRNYYTGAQRYGYGLWSGDIRTGFDSMKYHKDKLIGSINLGEAKWGMDTGGFIGTPDSENYTRWIQFSAFTPIFRVHGQDINEGNKVRYPWAYGEKAEAAAKSVMQLRYKLIPYIYKYDNEAYENGVGLIKSLMMAYPNDPNVAEYTDAWMFGDYLLVSPVLDQGQTNKSIYLPKGTWIDYAKGTTYTGGQTINYAVDAVNWSDVPLFIKQGAIIPSQDYENYVGEKKMTNIYVDCFPDTKASSFEYYDDDGNSTSYKEGNYFKQNFTLSRNDDWTGVEFTTTAKTGTYTPDVKYYIVKMHVKSNGVPTIDGNSVSKFNSLESLKSASQEGYATGTDVYGDVVYVKIAAGKFKTIDVPCDLGEAQEETVNIYARSIENQGKLQYSLDGGNTWKGSETMTSSEEVLGYLKGSISYKLTSSNPVRVRYSDSKGYKPSSKGVELPDEESDTFTIEKDGSVSIGKPVMSSTNLYIEADTSSVLLQYKDESGNWVGDVLLSPYMDTEGHFYYQLSYPIDIQSNTVRYSLDDGQNWLPSSSGQTVVSGDYKNDSSNKFVSGKPVWDNIVTVYYNCNTGFQTPYIHWRPAGGKWTTVPGTLMEDSEFDGYKKAVLNIGQETTAEVCFNNGSGSWDNNGGRNYSFGAGVKTFDKGTIKDGTPYQAVKGTVIVKYVDEDGNEILTSTTKTGNVGDSYKTTAKTISGYTLKTTPSNATGKFTESTITVTYVYSKTEPSLGTVIVEYADENGNEIATSTTKTGEVGESYTTTAKTISGYELVLTPTNANGTYKNGTITVTYKYKKVTIAKPAIESFVANKQSPQVSKTQVTLTVKATGTKTLQYKFLIKDNATGNWAVLRDYKTSNTYTWTTGKTGNKTLYVDVKDGNGQVTRKSMSYTVKEVEKPDVVSFVADKKSPQASGTEVTLSAAASGTGVLQYKFLVKDNTTGNWAVIRDYSIVNSCTWKANKAGNKTLYVDVKDSNGQVTRKAMSYTVKLAAPTVTSFTTDKKSPQKSKTEIVLSAKAVGTGTLQYKFLVKDSFGNWFVIQDYSASNITVWKPSKVGNKTLYVDVKDSNGQVTRKSLSYTIK
ncbi:MAG: TIM-barrel domain-containing protein [Clostridium sp.]